eukprot:CAMPEP_0196592464 /NCGR_PEP_ID=MMETSP1081-20130531/72818_1 /TAXON_ID=36882 /ORGANISM="Pyramimonas amylifera, Strain CCMP720" /LENGTH=317 /DNA_ID=CAMNT_0041916175 /DNA_START=82 /DNA_END=1032 /DNA_ORIENTATION=-
MQKDSVLVDILGDDLDARFDDFDEAPNGNQGMTGEVAWRRSTQNSADTPAAQAPYADQATQHGHNTDPVNEAAPATDTSGAIEESVPTILANPQYDRRFFILKSINHNNIASAIEHGVWATQRQNEEKLNHAYYSADKVYLVFSVNSSHHFQGYARMVSPILDRQNSTMWEGDVHIGGTFKISWQRLYDLPFTQCFHLRNPLNENKPVKISRDGQEMPVDLGDTLLSMIEEGAAAAGVPRPAGHNDKPVYPSRRAPQAQSALTSAGFQRGGRGNFLAGGRSSPAASGPGPHTRPPGGRGARGYGGGRESAWQGYGGG